VCFDFLHTFFRNICHCRKQCTGDDQKYLAIFMKSARNSCPILMKLEFCTQFFLKTLKYELSRKSVNWETSCFTRTDMTKLIVAFHNFTNAPKNVSNAAASTKTSTTLPHIVSYCSQVERQKIKICLHFSFRLSQAYYTPHSRHAS
jgi:hypothetical protein